MPLATLTNVCDFSLMVLAGVALLFNMVAAVILIAEKLRGRDLREVFWRTLADLRLATDRVDWDALEDQFDEFSGVGHD